VVAAVYGASGSAPRSTARCSTCCSLPARTGSAVCSRRCTWSASRRWTSCSGCRRRGDDGPGAAGLPRPRSLVDAAPAARRAGRALGAVGGDAGAGV